VENPLVNTQAFRYNIFAATTASRFSDQAFANARFHPFRRAVGSNGL